MQTRQWVIAVLCTAALGCRAQSADEQIHQLSLDQCKLATVSAMVQQETLRIDSEILSQQVEVMRQIQQLTKNLKPGASIGSQLDRDGMSQFSALSARFGAMNLTRYIESARARDAALIARMVQVADQNYRWGSIVEKSHPDLAIQNALDLYRSAEAVDPRFVPSIAVPSGPECGVDIAIYLYENDALVRMNGFPLPSALEQLRQISARNGGKSIDRAALSGPDAAEYDRIMTGVVNPAMAEKRLAYDYENIRLFARTARLIYDGMRQDALVSGGSFDAIGKTIQGRARSQGFDDRTNLSLKVWTDLNESYPVPVLKEIKRLGDIMNSRPTTGR